jgi:hypothetical protein
MINNHTYVATWTVRAPYGQKAWYSVSSPVRANSMHSFQITNASTGSLLVNIPAT